MTALEGCIKYHECILFTAKPYLSVSALKLLENTIKFLQELQKLKEEKTN